MISYDQSKIDYFLHRLESSTSILECNKLYVKDFYNYNTTRGITVGRRKLLLQESFLWAEIFSQDMKTATKTQIQSIIAKVMNRNDLAIMTKEKKITVLKQLYKHLLGDDEDLPPQMKWTRHIRFKHPEKKASDMLTRDDLKQLLKSCLGERESVILYFLWETGVRAGELLNIKISDLKDNRSYFTVEVDGKTGRRNIPIVETVPYMRKWLNMHPAKHDTNAPVFCAINGQKVVPLDQRGLSAIIKRTARRAGITKPVNPHHFRHSAATRLSSTISTAVLCKLMGWGQGSSMPATYLHLSNDQAIDAVLKIHGVNKTAVVPEPVEMVICPSCQFSNIPSDILCANCNRMLNQTNAIEKDTAFEKMQEEVRVVKALLNIPDEKDQRKRQVRRAIRKGKIKEWVSKWTKTDG